MSTQIKNPVRFTIYRKPDGKSISKIMADNQAFFIAATNSSMLEYVPVVEDEA